MATTTNYGWTTPDDTALVKDGAAAIRTLGTSVDTTTKNLNPSTTLGDIEYRSSTANTNTRLGIGTSGQFLSVVGGVPAWATVSTGGMTLLASGTLSGATTNLSSISGSYNDLQLIVNDFYPSTASGFKIRPNSLTTGYLGGGVYNAGGTAGVGSTYSDQIGGITQIPASSQKTVFVLKIFDYANTSAKKYFSFDYYYVDTGSTITTSFQRGIIDTTSAISNIEIITNSGTWSAGSYKLYGVK